MDKIYIKKGEQIDLNNFLGVILDLEKTRQKEDDVFKLFQIFDVNNDNYITP